MARERLPLGATLRPTVLHKKCTKEKLRCTAPGPGSKCVAFCVALAIAILPPANLELPSLLWAPDL